MAENDVRFAQLYEQICSQCKEDKTTNLSKGSYSFFRSL